jgi:transposase
MSPNNLTLIYAGIDVAKATLVLSLQDVCHTLENNAQGHTQLLKLLSQVDAKIHVILEATGGYESAVVRVLHAASVALSVMLPSRVRAFARAMGLQAKTDPIDAGLLAAFGAAIQPEPTMPPSEAQRQLTELVIRRAQLVTAKVVEQNRAEHYTDRITQRQSAKMLAFLQQQITECDRQILRQIKADEVLAARASRLQEVPGVGPVTAATLLAHMPELGTLDDGEAAALAGLAPYNCDSGPCKGTRSIRGGRQEVRCALYMAAMTAVRHDRLLRAFYQRLCAAGKKPMVALTAAMRKLILLLNRLLANPDFKLAA